MDGSKDLQLPNSLLIPSPGTCNRILYDATKHESQGNIGLTAPIILYLGGARSGKSRLAEAHARTLGGQLIYIATGEAGDAEMAARIDRHRADRGEDWTTIEAPLALADAIARKGQGDNVVLVDCLTLWLSNQMMAEHDIETARDNLCTTLLKATRPVLLVSNEVGQGIVPENALARRFIDEQGWLNQAIARIASEVWLVTAGLPQRLK